MSVLTNQKRVAVLRGGSSDERVASMQSGQALLDTLARQPRVTPVDIVVSKNHEWLHGGVAYGPGTLLAHVDLVLIALSGVYGEDGQVQRVLETHGVPYRGSTPMAAHSTLYKPHASKAAKAAGIRTPKQFVVAADTTGDLYSTAHSIQMLFGPQYVIKPAAGGAGFGVTLVAEAAQLVSALQTALARGEDFVVEEYIPGRTLSCGVVDGLRDTAIYQTSVVEYLKPFADTNATAFAEHEYHAPAHISDAERAQIVEYAATMHRALGLRDYSRADFQLGDDRQIYFLEINALPHLQAGTPMMEGLASVGVTADELLEHLVR